MSLDRRIVSILYYNNIFDVEKIENFTRVNEDYYEATINGKFEKLKVPGKEYVSKIDETIYTDFDDVHIMNEEEPKVEESKKEIKKKIVKKIEEIKKTQESIFKKKKEIADILKNNLVNEDGSPYLEEKEINEISFEDELKNDEKEKEIILEKINEEIKPEKPKNPKISGKKLKIVESKNIDDDINDFIDTL